MSENQPSSNFFKKHLGWVVTGFLTLLFWMQTCNLQNKIEEGKQEITKLELDKQGLTTTVNEQGKEITRQKAIITRSTESLNQLTDTIFNLKEKDRKNAATIAYFKEVVKVKGKDILVPYLDSLRMKRFSDSVELQCQEVIQYMNDSTIQVPRLASIYNDTLSLDLTVSQGGVRIDSLSIPDTLQLRFVEHKGKLFKRGYIETQWFHSNPMFQTDKANSVFYKPKRASFFKRVILPVGIGVGLGFLISK